MEEPASKRTKPNEAVAEKVTSMNNDVSTITVTPTKTSAEESNVTAAAAAEGNNTSESQGQGSEPKDENKDDAENSKSDLEKDEEDNPVVQQLLQDLRLAKSFDAAKEVMDKLFQELHSKDAEDYDPREATESYFVTDHISVPVAKSIVKSNGVFAVVMALNDFHHSKANVFRCKTVRLLYLISRFVPAAGQQLIESGAIRSLLKLASRGFYIEHHEAQDRERVKRNFEYSLKTNMIGLLSTLAFELDWSICKETVTEETLNFVISVMKKYPEDEYTQYVGIDYLRQVGQKNDPSVLRMLKEKKVCHIFADALDHFRDDDSPVKKTVTGAMEWYMSI